MTLATYSKKKTRKVSESCKKLIISYCCGRKGKVFNLYNEEETKHLSGEKSIVAQPTRGVTRGINF